jgi:dienelactone hydrolase
MKNAATALGRTIATAIGVGLGAAAGATLARAAYYTNLMLFGARRPLWRTPSAAVKATSSNGMPSAAGVRLYGWHIPPAGTSPAPAVVFVHGWPWNRCGNRAGGLLLPDADVDFLAPALALHRAGMHVLLFDLRNHGQSDAAPPVTFGVHEARDFAAAVAWLRAQPGVDGARIGAIGYSMGANTLLYGIPDCQPIRAAIAVQPVSAGIFIRNFCMSEFGPLGIPLAAAAAPLPLLLGGPAIGAITPADAARRLGETEMLYIQGDGDPWGAIADVEAIAAATPRARPIIFTPSADRYGGYQYVATHYDSIVEFFRSVFSVEG